MLGQRNLRNPGYFSFAPTIAPITAGYDYDSPTGMLNATERQLVPQTVLEPNVDWCVTMTLS